MDSGDTLQFLILIILLMLSAFFSSSEDGAYYRKQDPAASLAAAATKRAALGLDITENHTSKMLSAILIGNNIVNISASSLSATLAYAFGGIYGQHCNGSAYRGDPCIRRDHPEELRDAERGKDIHAVYPCDPVYHGHHDAG